MTKQEVCGRALMDAAKALNAQGHTAADILCGMCDAYTSLVAEIFLKGMLKKDRTWESWREDNLSDFKATLQGAFEEALRRGIGKGGPHDG